MNKVTRLFLLIFLTISSAAHAAIVKVEAEDETYVTRSGEWNDSYGGVLSNGQAVTPIAEGPTGASLTFTFEANAGTSLSIFGRTCPTAECLASSAQISATLDAGLPVSFSTYLAGSFTFQTLLGSFSGLSAGTHTLVLFDLNPYNNSQNIQIDFLEIDGIAIAASNVPLPATAWLFLSALGGVASLKHRARSSTPPKRDDCRV